jgi:hypothetical protein
MDETTTLAWARLPIGGVIRAAAADIHPPLYYMLVWAWQRIPLGLDWAVQARALSALFVLVATVAVDRYWLRGLRPSARYSYLALWTLSPGLLLYSRMCRSYSLQALIAVVAAAWLLRFAEKPSRKSGAAAALGIAAALYTHYVPGLALLAAANVLLWRKRRLRDAAAIDALCAAAYLPWIWKLAASLGVWASHSVYAAAGGGPVETALKLGYWAMSLAMGEAVPDGLLAPGALLLALAAVLALTAARRNPELGWLAGTAAAAGFLGVMRWVSYPFVPARMLFVFPLLLLLFVIGAAAHRRAGLAAIAGALILSLSGIWCYFHKTGFRNKQYPMPMAEIAASIRAGSTAADSAVLVDGANSDPPALAYALGAERPVLSTADPAAPEAVSRLLADPGIRTVWFLRNTHDVSGGLNAQLEARLGGAMTVHAHPYEPFTPLEIRMAQAMGMENPPPYFHELLEFRR